MGINGITLAHKLPLALSPGRCVAISAPALSYTHTGPECRCRLTPAILYIGMHAIGFGKWGLWYKHPNNGPPSSPANLGVETMPQSMLLVSQPSNTGECLLVSQGWAPPSNPSHLGEPPQLDSLAATWLIPVCQSQNKPPGNRRWAELKNRKAMFSCPDSCQPVFSENWLLLFFGKTFSSSNRHIISDRFSAIVISIKDWQKLATMAR